MKKSKKIENVQSSKKFLEDKKSIEQYFKGIISKKVLDERGIKLAMPL